MSTKHIWYLPLILFCWSCAQQGSPSGGPRDEDPPQVLECDPPNYSTQFVSKKMQITFDEYIVLDNVNQQLIVSPPMEEQPEVKLRKKTLIIEFEEALKENTTYTFNFGDAIKDLHEGNKLQNYEYVFSTGEILDSMSVRGNLKYAENLEVPDEPISIMLYSDLRDSVPLLDIPLYVGRSNDSGVFSVNNLRPDEYKVFALKDGNNNLLFDLPSEEIAFLDSSLIVNAEFARQLLADSLVSTAVPDTVSTDTSGIVSDSIASSGPDYNSIYIDLMLFTEASEIQYLTDNARDDRRKLHLVFALPLTDTFSYRSLQPANESKPRFLEHFSTTRDSLTLWIRDSTDYKKDSITLKLNYTIKDTTEQHVIKTDTVLFTYREKETKSRRAQAAQKTEEKLKFTTIRNNGHLDLNRQLALNIDFPIGSLNDTLFSLYHIPDSVEVQVPVVVTADTRNPYRIILSASWESDSRYRMLVLPGAIASIYPMPHDTIDVSFNTRDLEFYGQILLSLSNVNNRVLVQLFSGKTLVEEKTVEADGQYTFPFLSPKEYTFKFIHDLNGNGRWDTGNYLEKLQPEPVELLPTAIEVRSNWDHDVSMILEK
ncbi:MAG: Ig-like domain-containing protein [Bacteroidota bacterium]|nr:Ig-like domain-containing protein [Bacteroidota bacterium]